MIYYAKSLCDGVEEPAWLSGCRGLTRCDVDGKLVWWPAWSVGSPPPDIQWHDVGDGWSAGVAESNGAPWAPPRAGLWCHTEAVVDRLGVVWNVPIIYDRAYDCRAYSPPLGGEDWLPMPTEEQSRCEEIAATAWDRMQADGVEVSAGCEWTSSLLSVTHHIHRRAFRFTRALDVDFVTKVLMACNGLGATRVQDQSATGD